MLVSELALVGIALGGMFNVVRLLIGTQLIGTRYILTVAS